MKILTYYISNVLNVGTEETPELVIEQGAPCTRSCTDTEYPTKLAAAKAEAYQGVVTVEDAPDEPHVPSAEEQLRADIDYLALMGGVAL